MVKSKLEQWTSWLWPRGADPASLVIRQSVPTLNVISALRADSVTVTGTDFKFLTT